MIGIIAFISLIVLVVIHEFSHFIVAKRFQVGVEEFGIGYPPRLIARKISGTVYSLNALPFGAFVRIPERKLRELQIWQRAIILLAGIASFWVICVFLLVIVFVVGSPIQVSDVENGNLADPRVQVVAVFPSSPAESAGLQVGDTIQEMRFDDQQLRIDKVKQVQEFTQAHKGKEIILSIKRGKRVLEMKAVPRLSSPAGEGALGIALARVATKRYPLISAISQSTSVTLRLTGQIILGFGRMIKRLVAREPLGVEIVGPVGIFDIFAKAGILGPIYFLQTVALISLHVAVINALPIPVTDGGKVMFLVLEKIRKKPLNERIEQGINTVFFGLLIALMVWITIKDIGKRF